MTPADPSRSESSAGRSVSARDRLIVALDVPNASEAQRLVQSLGDSVGYFKVGLQLFTAEGPELVRDLVGSGRRVFLDLKLHDIPNTVAKAIQALHPLEPSVVTVHAAGGRAMLEDAKAAAPAGTKVVAVTVLTSLDESDLQATGVAGKPAGQVRRLARLARSAGLDGIVCSGAEVKAAHADWPEGFFVVPGIRPAGNGAADQKRVVTPRQALDAGASILVIGRPVTGADDPKAALREIEATL
jgi:orotidine-5'-phosphate decarboxylase